jgi:hypothetical protein
VQFDGEIGHLKKTFRQNAHSNYISYSLSSKHKPLLQQVEPTIVAVLPYQHSVTDKINRLLAEHSIKTIHILARKNIHMPSYAKDKLYLKSLGFTVSTMNVIKYMLDRQTEPLRPDVKSM